MTHPATGPLVGKVAIVTGAGRNIGRGIALDLAADGAAIVVNGRHDRTAVDDVAAEIEAAGGRALPWLADVSDESAVSAMVAAAVDRFGRIDILVSNAGLRRQTPLLDMSYVEWREILSVALDGAFLLTKACVPHMIAAGGGSIVALSGVSHHVGTRNRVHVAASKAGLEGLVRALSTELAEHRITVNTVAPGSIDTQRGASAGARPSSLGGAGVPLGRMGSVADISAMVRHLCRPEGAYVTGQTIHVNGGIFLT